MTTLQVINGFLKVIYIFLEVPNGCVTSVAKKSSDLACTVTVVDVKYFALTRVWRALTDGTYSVLSFKKSIILF
jgi:hypothetical protein